MDISLLKNTAIFAGLDDDELQRVAEICRPQRYKSAEVIFKEGEPGNRLFIVQEGSVRISRTIPGVGEEALAVLKPGACFGEMAVLDRSERSTDAIANDACLIQTIARPDFEMLVDFDHELGYKVMKAVVQLLCSRLRATNDSLRSFLAMSMF
ncbi:MAG: cyclic nucleotide-binding domain-containing protein [Gemmatimonadales bacterium]|nr:cyclic nucleotide-binding domain-containing protein [Gemmatimonadales bacterium]